LNHKGEEAAQRILKNTKNNLIGVAEFPTIDFGV
jgi:hypothetical protein